MAPVTFLVPLTRGGKPSGPGMTHGGTGALIQRVSQMPQILRPRYPLMEFRPSFRVPLRGQTGPLRVGAGAGRLSCAADLRTLNATVPPDTMMFRPATTHALRKRTALGVRVPSATDRRAGPPSRRTTDVHRSEGKSHREHTGNPQVPGPPSAQPGGHRLDLPLSQPRGRSRRYARCHAQRAAGHPRRVSSTRASENTTVSPPPDVSVSVMRPPPRRP
jgi:hypothetical protein